MACLLGTIVLAGVLVVPAYQRISVFDADINAAAAEADAARLLLDQRRQVKGQAASTSARLVQLSVAMPETPEMPSLIIDLHDTAYDAGVVLKSVSPAQPVVTEGQPFIALPLQIEIHGTWADTIEFMRLVGKLTRQVRINSFATDVLSQPSPEEIKNTGLSYPPYYQVRTMINATAYAIPASSLAESPTPEPASAE